MTLNMSKMRGLCRCGVGEVIWGYAGKTGAAQPNSYQLVRDCAAKRGIIICSNV